jgi:hypothetical protein
VYSFVSSEVELLEPNKKKVSRASSVKRRKKGTKITFLDADDTEQNMPRTESSSTLQTATLSSTCTTY